MDIIGLFNHFLYISFKYLVLSNSNENLSIKI